MDKDKALVLNDFLIGFFRYNWKIIGKEILKEINELLKKRKLLKFWNNTFLTLIPKVLGENGFKNFRPIIICNYTYKIIIKILTMRLQQHLQ